MTIVSTIYTYAGGRCSGWMDGWPDGSIAEDEVAGRK